MANPPPKRSFVVSYDEEEDKLTVCALNDADIAPLLSRALKADWSLASINHELTDDVARRLGATALSVLALYNPTLKPMLKVKLEPPELPESK
ncbi:hypothetical protein PQQ53_27500 [Paraburkholderia strydomiana]|jgi:hypothetical protein|uniref:hypothetical protein n=1 Tax=Paraburkholderia strydomiana TaxID=1245417 RepID=UPI0038BC758C